MLRVAMVVLRVGPWSTTQRCCLYTLDLLGLAVIHKGRMESNECQVLVYSFCLPAAILSIRFGCQSFRFLVMHVLYPESFECVSIVIK